MPKWMLNKVWRQFKVAIISLFIHRNWYCWFLARTIFQASQLSILSSPWRLLGEIAFRTNWDRSNTPPCLQNPTAVSLSNTLWVIHFSARRRSATLVVTAFQPRLTTTTALTNANKLLLAFVSGDIFFLAGPPSTRNGHISKLHQVSWTLYEATTLPE